MQIKRIHPFTIFYYTEQTAIAGLEKLTRTIAGKLYAAAVEAGLEITGPVYWLYTGFDGHPETIFTIEVALPVQEEKPYRGEFGIKQTSAFTCAAMLHTGSWYQMPETYGKIIHDLTQAGFSMTGHNREVYLHMDFKQPGNNTTEIQIGIQA